MKFDDANEIDSLVWQMRESDWPRAKNRALINGLFNGEPPYTLNEVADNDITVNVNDLASTRLGHDARSQLYSAFLKPGNYFRCSTDMGPVHHRANRAAIVTQKVNKIMKRSLDYFECFRSKFATNVLHGPGIAAWPDRDSWCPEPIGIEDVLIPANTLLTMRNLPFFPLYRTYTAPELIKLTRGPNRDAGWNMPLVKRCLQWIDQQTLSLIGTNWPEIWSPEKAKERIKGDGGFYVGDQVPTINVWDFYFYDDDVKDSGWYRRMILDSWSTPGSEGGFMRRTDGEIFKRREFLFNPGRRKYANKREELISFTFADLSAVSPFKYHTQRSFGFLVYALCHLQNRAWCKEVEAMFETLTMYLRVKSLEDVQRGLKVNMIQRGFIDESMQFITQDERWTPNTGLVELGMGSIAQRITENSASYTQNQNFSRDKVEKTKFQVMAEVNAMTAMLSAGLMQAYEYQKFEYREIMRRFMNPAADCRDPDVKEFRASCLRENVPLNMMVPEAWEVEPERVMGAGNKTLEMAIAEQLMEYRPLFDPAPQRKILRDVTLAITDDPARANELVPEEPQISKTVHDTELVFGNLMGGNPVTPMPGLNAVEVAGTIIRLMAGKVAAVLKTGGMGRPETVAGLNHAAQYASAFIETLSKDEQEKATVKKLNDALGKVMNEVKGIQQRQQEAAQKQAATNGGGGIDPKDAAKIAATTATAKNKIELAKQSHAARTAQKQISAEQKLKQDAERNNLEMAKLRHDTAIDAQKKRFNAFEE